MIIIKRTESHCVFNRMVLLAYLSLVAGIYVCSQTHGQPCSIYDAN